VRVEWRGRCDRVVAAASRVRVEDEADAGVGHAEEGVAQAIGGEDVGRREEEGFRDPPHGGVEAREVVMRPHGALDVELGGEEAPSALGLGVPGLDLRLQLARHDLLWLEEGALLLGVCGERGVGRT
jgi:hypothetical protein